MMMMKKKRKRQTSFKLRYCQERKSERVCGCVCVCVRERGKSTIGNYTDICKHSHHQSTSNKQTLRRCANVLINQQRKTTNQPTKHNKHSQHQINNTQTHKHIINIKNTQTRNHTDKHTSSINFPHVVPTYSTHCPCPLRLKLKQPKRSPDSESAPHCNI